MDAVYTDQILPRVAQPVVREVVFIEDNLADWNILSAHLAASAEVVVLDSAGDGLAQMATYLATRQPGSVDAIHVLSHGSAGQIMLGSATLTQDTLAQHAQSFNTIGQALSEQGDLLLYGCDVAAGDEGAALVQSIARASALGHHMGSSPSTRARSSSDQAVALRFMRKLILPFFPIGTGRTRFSTIFFNNDRFCGA